jgi:hypothetical protein
MLIERINEEELEFMEEFFNPVAFTECAFSTLHNLVKFDDELAEVRLGQFPMLSYEYMLDNDPKENSKENFRRRENAATIYCYGGRRFGKTLIVEQVDILTSMFLLDGEHVGFSSLDALHIRGIIEKIIQVLRTHSVFKILGAQINRSPNYRISLKNGYLFESVNMNIAGQTPGSGFFQKHFHRLYIEEGSFETDEVYNKRIDSVAEDGCIFRIAGMTNFTKYSPAGRTFFDLSKKRFVCNLPQFINPKWDFREKEKAIKENGGEMSAGYRVFVKGEVVEEGIAVFDMERVRACYNYEKQVKSFEINKDNFGFFKDILVLERPKNAEKVYVCADIGESAPTEIIIIYEVNGLYYYSYNIVAYRLDDKQQEALISFVINAVQANLAGLDTTDGTGRAILRALTEKYPKEQLVACSFNEKIGIDFERDPNSNRVVFDAGKPVLKEEYVSEWSVRRLKTLFYESKMSIPSDHKLDIQINSVIATTSGLRTVYTVVSAEDHLFSAFRVFAICQWMHEFSVLKPLNSKKFDKVGC